MFGQKDDDDDDIWGSMFGKKKSSNPISDAFGGKKSGGLMGQLFFYKICYCLYLTTIGSKENSTVAAVKAVVPGFKEESAFEKCLPNLTYKQVCFTIIINKEYVINLIQYRELLASCVVLELAICFLLW